MDSELTTMLDYRKNTEKFTVVLNDVLKETDDEKLKQEVQGYLAEIAQTFHFFVIGAEKTGRTTFLRNCFMDGDETILPQEETNGVLELHYGAQDIAFQVEENYVRKFTTNPVMEGMVLIDIGNREIYKKERAIELAKKADVIFAVFSSENIQDEYTWEFIEKNAVRKKVICVLNKSDLYSDEIVKNKEKKLQSYMSDINLETPIFTISDQGDNKKSYEAIKSYMRRNIIGQNPTEQKKQNNFLALVKAHDALKASVEKRLKQYEEDQRILTAMEGRIKEFYDDHEKDILTLKENIVLVIREEINNYQNSILRQFDPKELFHNPNTKDKKAFMDWLHHEVERYETILNNRVSEQTNKILRHYIMDINDICMELQEQLESRHTFIEDNDPFYGSLAKSRTTAVMKVRHIAQENHEEYMTLLEVSEELFNKAWNARKKRDMCVGTTKTAVATATTAAVGVAVLLSSGLVPAIVSGLALGAVGYEAGKHLAEMYFDGKLTQNMEKYIAEFKESIAKTRELMENKTLNSLDELFEGEFKTLDKSLLQMRSMNNIDTVSVPCLENKMQELGTLMEKLLKEKEDYGYC